MFTSLEMPYMLLRKTYQQYFSNCFHCHRRATNHSHSPREMIRTSVQNSCTNVFDWLLYVCVTCHVRRRLCWRDTASTAGSAGRRPGQSCWWRPGPGHQSTPGCGTLRGGGSKGYTVMSRLQLKHCERVRDDSTGRENTSSVYRILCYIGNIICRILENTEDNTIGEKQTP